mmetsp:Transcript_13018/g.27523  ORF Transcript_13018/g.27523 Transcript_13018/m.27523 type:complete len:173 (-) Transcript_13018:206-724(-)|eukprot:CAMPEP_0118935048 /NCGR_PEP_ID=MMETSP1169-20130426/14795_1 /TAXON_ID=36882 /ORGANISM="Pyramimonas obovata, Strain CCMP722" /LENGTH=172 /DNA_ID=CAMNT_0006878031 /DNA_START=123 /DNA_END=641 /DNA_ORIENTATION=+
MRSSGDVPQSAFRCVVGASVRPPVRNARARSERCPAPAPTPRCITEDTHLLEEDRSAIRKYQEETTRMRAEVAELRTSARIFQHSRCTACTAALDLPAVHFMCMHSFHARCLGDQERDCPKCQAENRTVLEIKRSLESSLSDHDKFFQQLESSEDGFSVVADYFGRGIFVTN